jgi:signal transduction histidine kinase
MKIKAALLIFILLLLCPIPGVLFIHFELNERHDSIRQEMPSTYLESLSKGFSSLDTYIDYIGEDIVVFITDSEGKVLNSNVEQIKSNEFLSEDILTSSSFLVNVNGNHVKMISYRAKNSRMVFWGIDKRNSPSLVYFYFVLIFTGLFVAVIISLIYKKFFNGVLEKLHVVARSIVEEIPTSKSDFNFGRDMGVLGYDLMEIQSKMKEINDAQREFLQNISHEMKTPLMSIQSYSEGILDGIIERDEIDDSLKLIISESHRLKNLVNELIYLGKLGSSTFMFNFNLHNLKDIIIDSLESVGGLAMKKSITFEYTPRSVFIQTDEEKLKQAFMNIFSNCIRHAKEIVSVKVVETNTNVDIIICDDGKGFSSSDLKNLFSRFSKGESGETGLGLFITKSIIDKHKGSIEVANLPKGGAQFSIRLNK